MAAQTIHIDLTLSDESDFEIIDPPPLLVVAKQGRRVSTDRNGSPAMLHHGASSSTSKAHALPENSKDEDSDIEVMDAPPILNSQMRTTTSINPVALALSKRLKASEYKLPPVLGKKAKRASKSILEQFVHPRVWIRALDRANPKARFTIDDYEQLWVYAVENLDLTELNWNEIRADMGLVAGIKAMDVDTPAQSQGSLGAGLSEISRRVADEEKIMAAVKEEVEHAKESIFKCELSTRADRTQQQLENTQKRLSHALENGDYEKAGKLEFRARKRARILRIASIDPTAVEKILSNSALTGSNPLPLGVTEPTQFFCPPPTDGDLPEGNDGRLNQDIACTEAKHRADGGGPRWRFNPVNATGQNAISSFPSQASTFEPHGRVTDLAPDVPMSMAIDHPIHDNTQFFHRRPLPPTTNGVASTWGRDRYPFLSTPASGTGSASSYTAQPRTHVSRPIPKLIDSKEWYAGSSDFPLEMDFEDVKATAIENSASQQAPWTGSSAADRPRPYLGFNTSPPRHPFVPAPSSSTLIASRQPPLQPQIKNEPQSRPFYKFSSKPAPASPKPLKSAIPPPPQTPEPKHKEFDINLKLHFSGMPCAPRRRKEVQRVRVDNGQSYENYIEAIHGDLQPDGDDHADVDGGVRL